ncbi:NOP2, partial [Cordylochernes scorpioides]
MSLDMANLAPKGSPGSAEHVPERPSILTQAGEELAPKNEIQRRNSKENSENEENANSPGGDGHANPAAARGDVTAPKTSASTSATSASPASLNWADSEMAEVNNNEGFIVVKGKKRRLGSTSPEHAARQPNKPGEQRSSQQRKRPTGPRAVPPQEIKATSKNIAEAKARQNSSTHENYIFVERCPEFPDYTYLKAISKLVGEPNNITYFGKMNGHFLVGLATKDLARRLAEGDLEIEGTTPRVFPYRKRAERIVVANLPGFVDDFTVVNALSPYGRVTSIAPILIKMGEFTFTDGRREAFILLKDGIKLDRLPTRLDIQSKGDSLPAFLSFGIKCSKCGKQGHRRANCPSLARQNSSPRQAASPTDARPPPPPPPSPPPPQQPRRPTPAPATSASPVQPAKSSTEAPVTPSAHHPTEPMDLAQPAPVALPAPLAAPRPPEPETFPLDIEMSEEEQTSTPSASPRGKPAFVQLQEHLKQSPNLSIDWDGLPGIDREDAQRLLTSKRKMEKRAPSLSKAQETNAFHLGSGQALCLGYSAVILAHPVAISGSGLACVFGPGVAVLRQRILWPGHIALATIDVRGEEMTAIAVHLAHEPRERNRQLELLAATAAQKEEGACWIIGDFNIRDRGPSSSSSSDALAALLDLAALVDVATQFDAAHLPTRVAMHGDQVESNRLDRILVPAGVLDRVSIYATSHYHLSDHRLVLLQVGPPTTAVSSPTQPRLAAMLRSGLALEHLAGYIRELEEDAAHDDDDGTFWDRWTSIKAGLLAEARSLHDPRHAASDSYVYRARRYIAAQLEASSIRADYPSLPDLARAIRLRRPVSVIRDDEDNVIEGPELRRRAFATFRPRFARPTTDPAAGAAFIASSAPTTTCELSEEDPLHRPDISPSEIANAIEHLPRGKAPGWDGLPCELIVAFNEDFFAEALARVFAASRLRGALPPSTRRSSICLVPKARGGRGLDGYRPSRCPRPTTGSWPPSFIGASSPTCGPLCRNARLTPSPGGPRPGTSLSIATGPLLRRLELTLGVGNVIAYADDIVLLFHRDEEFERVATVLEDFKRASGIAVNLGKSAGLWCGAWRNRGDSPLGASWSTTSIRVLGLDIAPRSSVVHQEQHLLALLESACRRWTPFTRGLSLVGRARAANSLVGSTIQHHLHGYLPSPPTIAKLQARLARFVWGPEHTAWLPAAVMARPVAIGGLGLLDLATQLQLACLKGVQVALRGGRNAFSWLVESGEAWIHPPPDGTRLQPRRLRLLKLWEETSNILGLNHRAVPTAQLLDLPIIGGCRFLRPPDLLAPARWRGARVRDLLAEGHLIARPTRSVLADAATLGAFCRRLTSENAVGFGAESTPSSSSLAAAVVLRGTATPFLNGLTTRSARRALVARASPPRPSRGSPRDGRPPSLSDATLELPVKGRQSPKAFRIHSINKKKHVAVNFCSFFKGMQVFLGGHSALSRNKEVTTKFTHKVKLWVKFLSNPVFFTAGISFPIISKVNPFDQYWYRVYQNHRSKQYRRHIGGGVCFRNWFKMGRKAEFKKKSKSSKRKPDFEKFISDADSSQTRGSKKEREAKKRKLQEKQNTGIEIVPNKPKIIQEESDSSSEEEIPELVDPDTYENENESDEDTSMPARKKIKLFGDEMGADDEEEEVEEDPEKKRIKGLNKMIEELNKESSDEEEDMEAKGQNEEDDEDRIEIFPEEGDEENQIKTVPDFKLAYARIRTIVGILANFSKFRQEGKSRADYLQRLAKDLCLYFSYNEYLMEKLMDLFNPSQLIEFLEANENQRTETIRVNSLKTNRRNLAQALSQKGFKLDKLDYSPVGLVVYNSAKELGSTTEYLAGHYIKQGGGSWFPVMALAPQENEVILDMCAAPGGKTTHIGQIMRNTGVIVANDYREDRIKAVVSNLHRMGVANAVVCVKDGRDFPKCMSIIFDRVLLDAPCSGTGVISKEPQVKESKDYEQIKNLAHLQKQLILCAIDSLKVKGTLVYSTCSVLVEENEDVIQYALNKRRVKLVPTGLTIGIDGFTKIARKRYHPTMKNTKRFYPHTHNVEGFFVAKLVKLESLKPKPGQKDGDNLEQNDEEESDVQEAESDVQEEESDVQDEEADVQDEEDDMQDEEADMQEEEADVQEEEEEQVEEPSPKPKKKVKENGVKKAQSPKKKSKKKINPEENIEEMITEDEPKPQENGE